MKKTIFSILTFVVALQTNAQVFIGSGFAEADSFGPSGLDFAAGFTFQLERDYKLWERLKMHPNINISFLHSNADRVVFPSYLNVFSPSPKVSYEIVSKARFKLAPFANPFASYLLGLKGNDFFTSLLVRINLIKLRANMKYIVLASFVLFSVTGINAQVFIGLGFSNAQLGERALDDDTGLIRTHSIPKICVI